MALIKCPRCELNYIKEGESLCNICKRELRREEDEAVQLDICTECNEAPVVPGEDLCILCLREKMRQENLEKLRDSVDEEEDEDTELIEAEKLEDVVPIDEAEILVDDFGEVSEDLDVEAEDFADEAFDLEEEPFPEEPVEDEEENAEEL